MITREILNSHPVTTLRKEISKTNIKGYSKMTKPQVVELMMKNKDRFSHIKMKDKGIDIKVLFEGAKAKTKTKKAPMKIPEPNDMTMEIFNKFPIMKKLEYHMFGGDGMLATSNKSRYYKTTHDDIFFPDLIRPAEDPKYNLKGYKTEFTKKSWIKEQRRSGVGINNLMGIAHKMKFKYKNFKEFIEDFKRIEPEYFKYWKEWTLKRYLIFN